MNENFTLGIYWLDYKITAGEYIHLVYGFLISLKDFSDDFIDPKMVGKNGEIEEVSTSYDQFQSQLLPILQKEDNWYRDADGNKSLVIQPGVFSDLGFYREFIFDKDEEAILLSVNAGNYSVNDSNFNVNNVLIEFPGNDLKYTDYTFVKSLFQLAIKFWSPKVGWVISSEFRRKVANEANTYIGWLNYFSDLRIKELVPESIGKENFHTGFITSLSSYIPSADNSDDVQKAIAFRDLLSKNNVLNWR